jgi:hypothetical protein
MCNNLAYDPKPCDMEVRNNRSCCEVSSQVLNVFSKMLNLPLIVLQHVPSSSEREREREMCAIRWAAKNGGGGGGCGHPLDRDPPVRGKRKGDDSPPTS